MVECEYNRRIKIIRPCKFNQNHFQIYSLLVFTLFTHLNILSVIAIGFRYDQSPTQVQYSKASSTQTDPNQIRSQLQERSNVRANEQRELPYRLHPDRFRVGVNGCLIRVFLQRKITPARNHFNAPKIDYFGVIGIGKSEYLFNVMFDTTSRESWVPARSGLFNDELHHNIGYSCVHDDCSYVAKYDFIYANSRTTRLKSWIYEDNFTLFEDIQKDDVGHLITKQFSFPNVFLAAKEASNNQFKYKNYDGVIGLSPVVSQGSMKSNFLLALQEAYNYKIASVNNSIVSKPNPLVFGIWFNPNQQSHHGGEITFGGYDTTKVASEFRYHKLSSYTDWQLRLESVRLGSATVSCNFGCNILLDTATNSLFGPEQDVFKIHSMLGSFREPASGLYIIDCSSIDSLPRLQFVIEFTPYELDHAHYVKIFKFKDMIICHVDIKPWREANWRVGTAFIGAYYSVFDMAERRVGFATTWLYT